MKAFIDRNEDFIIRKLIPFLTYIIAVIVGYYFTKMLVYIIEVLMLPYFVEQLSPEAEHEALRKFSLWFCALGIGFMAFQASYIFLGLYADKLVARKHAYVDGNKLVVVNRLLKTERRYDINKITAIDIYCGNDLQVAEHPELFGTGAVEVIIGRDIVAYLGQSSDDLKKVMEITGLQLGYYMR